MSDLTCRCTVAPTRSLSRTLESFRSDIASNASRISSLETSYLSLNASVVELANFLHIVTNEAEFIEALEDGVGDIGVQGEIETEAQLVVSQPNTRVWGLPGSKVTNVNRTGNTSVFLVKAPGAVFSNLEMTQDDPLDDPSSILTAGINLSFASGEDVSGLWIDRCNIHGVRTCIQRSGAAAAEVASRIRLTNNFLHSFSHSGIYMNYHMEGMHIFNNDIRGRVGAESHDVVGNGILTGEYCHDLTVERNIIQQVDRNGIEHYSLPGNLVSNRSGQFLNNRVYDVAGIGMSIFGSDSTITIGNQLKNIGAIGLEIFNSAATLGENIVAFNFIKNVLFAPTVLNEVVGMSLDAVSRAMVYGNTIENVRSTNTVQSIGMQILNGGTEIVIEGNKFRDAGNAMLWINGDGVAVFNRIKIHGNDFFFTTDFAATYADQVFSPAIRVANATAVVTDNTSFIPSGASYGRMFVTNTGVAYAGNEFEDAISNANNGAYIRGSNRVIQYP
jgi:hypothetical protein